MEAHAKRTEKSITGHHDLRGKGRHSRLQQQHRQRSGEQKCAVRKLKSGKEKGGQRGQGCETLQGSSRKDHTQILPTRLGFPCYWQVRWLVQDYPGCVGCSAASCPTPGRSSNLFYFGFVSLFYSQYNMTLQYPHTVQSVSRYHKTLGEKLSESRICKSCRWRTSMPWWVKTRMSPKSMGCV